jgi:hypothetical protein
LQVNTVGPYSLELDLSTIREIAEICSCDNPDKVLVDLRKINTNISIMDRYDIGVEVSSVMRPEIRVAAVTRLNLINYMGETVATNRGAKLKVFSKIEKALEWLGVEEKK